MKSIAREFGGEGRLMRQRPSRARTHRRRLSVERLEQRRVLATIVVNTDDPATTEPDDDIISFRDALTESNSTPEIDTIVFADTVDRLEDIGVTVRAPVVIDGTGVTIASGFLNQATIRVANHTGTTIKNFIFEQASNTSAAILIDGGEGHTIIGNHFQGPPDRSRVGLGIEVSESDENTIGGTDPGTGNVFTNLNVAIQVDDEDPDGIGSDDTRIVGNLIGVDDSGTAIRNRTGIAVNDTIDTLIEGNTISANSNPILLATTASNADIINNRIGLAPVEDVPVANFGPVLVRGSFHVVADNVISGNTFATALEIAGSNNTVRNNFIGTNSTGTERVANSRGIVISPGNNPENQAKGNTIGPGNIISGNAIVGIQIETEELNPNIPENNTIVGNTIGLSANKLNAIANGTGIDLDGARNTTIGGDATEEANVISGNSSHGISAASSRIVGPDFAFISVPTDGTIIEGNFIGVSPDATAPIPNGGDGIRFNAGVQFSMIGSPTVPLGSFSNVIQGNTGHGIRITEPGSHANLGNKILGNGKQDVDTGPLGPNENDDPDSDGITNTPLITAVREGSTEVSYELEGAEAGQTVLVELFNEKTGALVSRQEQRIVSGNLFTETIPGAFIPQIVAVATPKIDGTFGQSSEQGKTPTPPGDLQIKGNYERESHFGGEGEFAQDIPSDEQTEEIFQFLIPDESQESTYQFDVRVNNAAETRETLRLAGTEVGVNSSVNSPQIKYFLRGKEADGGDLDISTQVRAGTATFDVDAGKFQDVLISITRSLANRRAGTPDDDPVSTSLQVFSRENEEPDDMVIAIASTNPRVNTDSDLEADEDALAAGVIDVEADKPGQQISLRGMLTYTNELPGRQEIRFEEERSFRIEIEGEPLPEITDAVSILGPDIGSEFEVPPKIEIISAELPRIQDGLVVSGQSTDFEDRFEIESIAVNGFERHGIHVKPNSFVILKNVNVGVQSVPGDSDDTSINGNGGFGIFAERARLLVSRGVIANNGLGGVLVRNGIRTFFIGTRLGVDPLTNQPIRSAGPGIEIRNGSSPENTDIERVVIGGHEDGVVVRDSTTTVQLFESQIGAHATSLDNPEGSNLAIRRHGILLENTKNAVIRRSRITASGDSAQTAITVLGESAGLVIRENVLGQHFDEVSPTKDAIRVQARSSDTSVPNEIHVDNNRIQLGVESGISILGLDPRESENVKSIRLVRLERNQIEQFGFLKPAVNQGVGVKISNAVEDIRVGSTETESEAGNKITFVNIGVDVSFTGEAESAGVSIGHNSIRLNSNSPDGIGVRSQFGRIDEIAFNTILDSIGGIVANRGSLVTVRSNEMRGPLVESDAGIQIVDAKVSTVQENRVEAVKDAILLSGILDSTQSEGFGSLVVAANEIGLNTESKFASGRGIEVKDSELHVIALGNKIFSEGVGIGVDNVQSVQLGTVETELEIADKANRIVSQSIPVLVQQTREELASRIPVVVKGNTLESTGTNPVIEIVSPTNALRIEENVLRRTGETDTASLPHIRRATVLVRPDKVGSGVPMPGNIQLNDIVGPGGVVLTNGFGGDIEPLTIINNDIQLIGSDIGIPIDLHVDSDTGRGITPNDRDERDSDTGPNGLQNSPSVINPEATTFELQTAFSFVSTAQILAPFALRSTPNTTFLIEFALSDETATIVTDGLAGEPGIVTARNRIVVTTDGSGFVADSARISGLNPSAPLQSLPPLTNIVATATPLEIDANSNTVSKGTSEFSTPVRITFIEPNSSNDQDGDGKVDRFEDVAPGLFGELLFGDVNDDGIQDAQQQEVIAAPVDGPVSVSPPGNVSTGSLDANLGASASVEALGGSRIVGSGAVVEKNPDPERVVADGALNLVVLQTNESTAQFRYTQATPFIVFHKSFRTGVIVDGEEQTSEELFLPSTTDFPAGISIEFTEDKGLHVATVTIEDGSLFDFDDREGFVADPFAVSLGDALVATTGPGNSQLIVDRSGDSLQVTDSSGDVLQSSVLADTAAAALEAVGTPDGRIVVNSDPADPIVLPHGFFLIGNGGNDEFIVDGVFSTLIDAENQSPLSVNGRAGRDRLSVTGSSNFVDLDSSLLTLNNIEVLDASGSGANSVVLNVDSIRRVTDQNNQLLVETDLDDALDIGPGWTLTGTEIVDGELVRILAQDGVTLRSIGPSEWTNPVDAFDVNADGIVSPTDALGVINELARGRVVDNEGNLLPAGQEGVFQGRFVDVLARGTISPRDALVIINRLARQQNTAEGESSRTSTAAAVQSALLPSTSPAESSTNPQAPREVLNDSEVHPRITQQSRPAFQPAGYAEAVDHTHHHDPDDRAKAVDEFFTLMSPAKPIQAQL